MQQPEPEQQTTDEAQRHQEGPPPEEAAPSLEQQLAEIQQQKQACLDTLRRTQADFINYKRRAAQEQAETRVAAQAALLQTLLPVLDDLGRALEAVPEALAQQPWVQGILLVARRLQTTLQHLGAQQIGAPGERFDPNRHEAVMTEARSDLPEGTIVRVERPGYVLLERIIRPAQVVVAAAPVAAAEAHADS